ncbi:hypothetical protein SX4_1156 [Vibrio mimicus SX-4]|nr:hypothetical protein SX4_1156 [Vibrio mimicus SX-4]
MTLFTLIYQPIVPFAIGFFLSRFPLVAFERRVNLSQTKMRNRAHFSSSCFTFPTRAVKCKPCCGSTETGI